MTVQLDFLTDNAAINFMAAIGLVRVLAEDCGLAVALGWPRGQARLEGISEAQLLDALVAHMAERYRAPELNWTDSPRKLAPDRYRQACAEYADDPRCLQFLGALATDTVLTRAGEVSTSRLDLTSGNQRLVSSLRSLAREFEQPELARELFQQGLLAGIYQEQSSFGWDAATLRQHATEARAPTLMAPPGRKAVIWLAAEGLALHPLYPDEHDRARTTGCVRLDGGNWSYFWPSWQPPLLLDEIRYLRGLELEPLKRRGDLQAIWSAVIGQNGKYGQLLPGRRLR